MIWLLLFAELWIIFGDAVYRSYTPYELRKMELEFMSEMTRDEVLEVQRASPSRRRFGLWFAIVIGWPLYLH